jgi:hypothetical protein
LQKHFSALPRTSLPCLQKPSWDEFNPFQVIRKSSRRNPLALHRSISSKLPLTIKEERNMPQRKAALQKKRASAKKSPARRTKVAALRKSMVGDLKSTRRKATAAAKKLWRSAEDLVTSTKKSKRKKRTSSR